MCQMLLHMRGAAALFSDAVIQSDGTAPNMHSKGFFHGSNRVLFLEFAKQEHLTLTRMFPLGRA